MPRIFFVGRSGTVDIAKKYARFAKFCVVGIVNTAVDYGLFYLLISYFALAKEIANALSVSAAVSCGYFLNKHWSFSSGGSADKFEVLRFVAISIVSLFVSNFLIHIFFDVLDTPLMLEKLCDKFSLPRIGLHGALVICKLIAAPVVTAVSYLGNKHFVFRQ